MPHRPPYLLHAPAGMHGALPSPFLSHSWRAADPAPFPFHLLLPDLAGERRRRGQGGHIRRWMARRDAEVRWIRLRMGPSPPLPTSPVPSARCEGNRGGAMRSRRPDQAPSPHYVRKCYRRRGLTPIGEAIYLRLQICVSDVKS
jgi:hypothetical protein